MESRERREEPAPPWQVWVIIAVLVIAGLIQIPMHVARHHLPTALFILVVSVALIYGLIQRQRWAFLVSLFFCFSSILVILKNPAAAFFNLTCGAILLTAYPHFFKKTESQNGG